MTVRAARERLVGVGGREGGWRYDQSGRAAGGQSWINPYKD